MNVDVREALFNDRKVGFAQEIQLPAGVDRAWGLRSCVRSRSRTGARSRSSAPPTAAAPGS